MATVIQRNGDGSLLKIADIADVTDAIKDPDGIYRASGKPSAGMIEADGNSPIQIVLISENPMRLCSPWECNDHWTVSAGDFGSFPSCSRCSSCHGAMPTSSSMTSGITARCLEIGGSFEK